MKTLLSVLFSALASLSLVSSVFAYEAKSGDTVWGLSRDCGVTVSRLAEYNGIKNPSFIRVGQEIKCPISNLWIPEVEQLGARTLTFNFSQDYTSYAILTETPENPPEGEVRLYYKDDGFLYQLDSSGTETIAGGGGGGGDMYKTTYDTNADDEVDTAALADNSTLFNGQVATYYATASDLGSTTSSLNTHIANTSNPHTVTAAQVGSYTTAQADALLANKVASSTTVNGHALTGNVSVTASDVGLGNVDNTSDATKNSALATLTNKTIDADDNTVQDLDTTNFATGVVDTDSTLSSNSDTRLATQKAVKAFVEALQTGTAARVAVDLATTTTLPACTYNNGTGGVGATLTGDANGALIVDGTDLDTAGAEGTGRILVKDQANAAHNGTYLITEAGTTTLPFVLTRTTDYDQASGAEIVSGSFFTVVYGTENDSSLWMLATTAAITVGSTDLVFTPLPTAGAYTASNGIKLVSQDMQADLSDTNPSLEISDGGLRAKVDDSTIERTASGLGIKNSGVTNAKVSASAAIAYSKLALTNEILNADIDDAAAIAETKLALDYGTSALNTAITNASTTLDTAKLNKSLNDAWIFIGNGSNVATGQDITGDIEISNTGVSAIGSGKVTNDMLAGSIADSKLSTIGTENKVSWSAVNKAASAIDDIADVNTTGVADGNCLVYESGSSSWIDGECSAGGDSGANATSTMSIPFSTTAATWTNMPAATTTLFGSTAYHKIADLTSAVQFRITIATRAGTVGTGADLNLEYSTDRTTWYAANSTYAGELAIDGASGSKIGSWVDLVAGAKQDVYLRIVGKQGDGVQDPIFYSLVIEFRQSVSGGGAATPYYGDFYIASSTASFSISTVNTYQALGIESSITTGTLASGITFNPGAAGPVFSFADAGGGAVRASTTAHSIVAGDIVSFDQGSDYDGMHVVTNVPDSTHFDFTDTYIGADGGAYNKGAYLQANTSGVYDIRYNGSLLGANAGDTIRLGLHKNATLLSNTLNDASDVSVTSAMPFVGGGLVTLAANDKVVLGVSNLTTANGFTPRHLNVAIHKIN